MPTFRSCVSFVVAIGLAISPVGACSEVWHHVVAILAFDQLNAAEQDHVIELLEKHPRFEQDFVYGREACNKKESQHWIVGRAGYWPDLVKDMPEFARPNWHFQLGSTLTLSKSVEIDATPGVLPQDSNMRSKDIHIAQAIVLCRRTLQGDLPDPEKAVAICWLIHLVADAHQPCNAGSLYVDGVFPNGDERASCIPTNQGTDLHTVWDGLLGDKFDVAVIHKMTGEINQLLWQAQQYLPDTDDPRVWIAESQQLARVYVYTPKVLAAVEIARDAGTKGVAAVDLSNLYLTKARELAKVRAAFAANRLAKILVKDLGP